MKHPHIFIITLMHIVNDLVGVLLLLQSTPQLTVVENCVFKLSSTFVHLALCAASFSHSLCLLYKYVISSITTKHTSSVTRRKKIRLFFTQRIQCLRMKMCDPAVCLQSKHYITINSLLLLFIK